MGQFVEETSKAPSPFAYCSREGLAASKLACLVALDVGPRSSLGAVKERRSTRLKVMNQINLSYQTQDFLAQQACDHPCTSNSVSSMTNNG